MKLGIVGGCLSLALVLMTRAALSSENSVMRAEPLRPATITLAKRPLKWSPLVGGEYAKASDLATFLGLKGAWLEPKHKFAMSDETTFVQLERDRIESQVNGLGVRLGSAPIFQEGELYVSRIDVERYLIPRIRPALVGALPARTRIIVIDPGHAGKDNGMENAALGLKEKVLTLDVALRLKTLLEAAGFKVVLTRTGDIGPIFKELPLRAKLANDAKADLFVSIHFNSLYPDTKTSGTETYVYTPQFQRSTKALGPGQPDDVRRDATAVNRWDAWSALLADRVQREVQGRLKTVDRGQKTMHALVMQDLNCPAILVESMFVSNDAEARRAAKPEYRQQIAAAIAAGIGNYVATLDELRPPEIRPPLQNSTSSVFDLNKSK